jgi:nitrite reductase/ring-hydroxylating ferredoxin subunit
MLSHFRKLHRKLVQDRKLTKTLGTIGPAKFLPLDDFILATDFQHVVSVRERAPTRTVVLGDLHGDFAVFLALLGALQCIDRSGNWIGQSTTVVQVGDFLDGGGRVNKNGEPISVPSTNPREEIDIIQYAWFLDVQAREHGGEVILLAGNHEYMNFAHDFSCASSENIVGFGGLAARKQWFTVGSAFASDYFQKRHPVMLHLGPLLFVHGGLGKTCMVNDDTPDTNHASLVNAGWSAFLTGQTQDINMCVRDALFSRTVSDHFEGTDAQCDHVLDPLLERLGFDLHTIVCMGHTPQIKGYQPQSGVNGVCGKRAWRVDVAAAKAFGKNNRAQGLEITSRGNNKFDFDVVSAT